MKVFAIAGGGSLPLDDYLVNTVVGKEKPNVCYIPTASGDNFEDIRNFWMSYRWRCNHLSVLSLFNRSIDDLYEALTGYDLIYAGGGNTVNLLAVWRAHGLDMVLRKVAEEGTVLAGISAGALCWFSGGLTDSLGPGYNPLRNGLGFLPYSFCPHMNHKGREDRFLEYAADEPGIHYGAEDHVGLYFRDGALMDIVASVRGPKAVWVRGGMTECLDVTPLIGGL